MSEIWKALLEVQKEAPALQRDGLNPHFKSSYVTLETVMETVLPILNRHGVVLMQAVGQDDSLETRLVHAESGEEVNCAMTLHAAKEDMQGYGSAMTYARRYAIMGMLGLVADADDDGNAASAAPKKKEKPKPMPEVPTNYAELEVAMRPWGQSAWDDMLVFGAHARDMMFPLEEGQTLSTEQRDKLWQTTLAVAQRLFEKFDPTTLPPPLREDVEAAWAWALSDPEFPK